MAEIDPDDVILWLVPQDPDGSKYIRSTLSATCPGSSIPSQICPPTLRGEESEAESPSNKDPACGAKGLVFLFSHGAKTTAGIIGGTAANVDFHLPTAAGVSDYHFAITFNSRNQPIVKDLGSLGGTKVTYTGERGQRLSNFEWPLLGPSIANGMPPLLHASSRSPHRAAIPHETTWRRRIWGGHVPILFQHRRRDCREVAAQAQQKGLPLSPVRLEE